MADPLPIIGLASSIITFIEFGIRITRTARSIRVAADGKAPEIQELQKNLEEMLVSKQQILDRKDAGRVSGNERQIANTVKECDKLAGEIKEVIDDLTGPRSLFGSGGVAIRVVRRRNELDKLRKRLRDQDSKIRECLQHLLDRERHSQLLTELRMIHELHVRHKINQSTDIRQLRKDIFEISTTRSDDIETTEAQVTRLRTKLEKLDQEAERQRMQAQVIESLYVRVLERRRDDIITADSSTNSWLHDSQRTYFSSWLESNDRKSILYQWPGGQRKIDFDEWAGPLDLSCASHFFWNQGFSLEKSQEGLLQSLLYQILKQVPSLALLADPDRPRAEEWKFEQLQSFFGRITLKTSLSTKFCLFIDGLDEYDGDETHIAELISSISQSQHIKVCISTRPRTTFQNLWPAGLSMKDFTQNDMKVYVEKILGKSKEFEALQLAGPTRDALVNEIAKHAKGVWLWVELVTKDIIQAAKTEGDDPDKFQEILKGFPPDLEEYFKHIISRVNQLYRVEMAKFFLITIFEVQPLPLYAFYLLHHEEKDPDYAVKAEISELAANDAIRVGKDWKEKIKYRCSDLLIVGKDEHPVFLMQPVDFLHRTVRDFLRDWFQDDLYKELKSTLVPPISLCRIMLFFLKKQPQGELNSPKHYNRMIGLVDELLYYAREAEKHDRCGDLQLLQVADILDEVDRVNTTLMKRVMNNHWTHARDPPRTRGYDEYRERGNSNFIALAVQARLVKHHWEGVLNTIPQFRMEVEDDDSSRYDVHFMAIFSGNPRAIPVLFLHGWPGSVVEFLPLLLHLKSQFDANPADFGYHIIAPSLIGFGWSSPPPNTKDFCFEDNARLLSKLMANLGFSKTGYVVQGGDIGSPIACSLAAQDPACKLVHVNLFVMSPLEGFDESHMHEYQFSDEELTGLQRGKNFWTNGTAYALIQATRPSTVGIAIGSSPVALLAWIGEKMIEWSDQTPTLDLICVSLLVQWMSTDVFVELPANDEWWKSINWMGTCQRANGVLGFQV
ncbi:hypothetical protein CEP52_010038 [Fusarium oligoseptatum]|uniref:Uncharacterized protein n=1 Tax=Fusarium oligoseptatum TaxID=2604345 RepID=A0A428TA75_9HYPO|nr:hypothetical protein CEP52_010038 [Fusarium oligoseptatum]